MRLSRAARIRRTAHTRVVAAAARREREVALRCPSTAWHGEPMSFAASRLHYPKMLF